MGGDFVEFKHLQESFKRHDTGANSCLSTIAKFASSAADGFLRQAGKTLVIALGYVLPLFFFGWIREAFLKRPGGMNGPGRHGPTCDLSVVIIASTMET